VIRKLNSNVIKFAQVDVVQNCTRKVSGSVKLELRYLFSFFSKLQLSIKTEREDYRLRCSNNGPRYGVNVQRRRQ
jgi:hypothetical protein